MSLSKYENVIHRCFRCGYCKFPSDYDGFICNAYNQYRMESHSPGGMLWLARAMMQGEIESSKNLFWILYRCTMCFNCAEKCPMEFKVSICDMLIAARNEIIEKPGIPQSVRQYLENMMYAGNPWKKAKSKRGKWNQNDRFPMFNEKSEYLYYVGDLGSYSTQCQGVAYMLGELLEKSQVDFGILGSDEKTDGNEVQKMGEQDLFEWIARQNITLFKERGIKKILTLSPHAYHCFKREYPSLGGIYEVIHYTHILQKCISDGFINYKHGFPYKITYHDPCFLGRWNQEYDTSRKILKTIPDATILEMRRNRADALCCGGGNGNVFTNMVGSAENCPARIRVKEAVDCGAEILAVACP